MLHFHEVFDRLATACPLLDGFADLTDITVIRDLEGKINLCVAFADSLSGHDSLKQLIEKWKSELERELGPFWGGHIWTSDPDSGESDKALFELIEKTRRDCSNRFAKTESGPRWFCIERHFSKSAWLQEENRLPPWPVSRSLPGIVTFHSFKGGVGRTTVLSAMAVLFARAGYHVAMVDLDLEAPGVGTFVFGNHPGRVVQGRLGIADYLIEKPLFGDRLRLQEYVEIYDDWSILGEGSGSLHVMGAGQVNREYVEKLARIDYEGMTPPEENQLRILLQDLRSQYNLDLVFLDARAGLHDIGGLSLMGLSHLDVLFGIDSEQSWAGIATLISLLAGLDTRPHVQIVQALTQPEPSVRELSTNRFRERSYEVFRQIFYNDTFTNEVEELPDLRDEGAPHFPVSILDKAELRQLSASQMGREHLNAVFTIEGFRRLQHVISSTMMKPISDLRSAYEVYGFESH
jgi:cellulose biosynthesis protein BcsQ